MLRHVFELTVFQNVLLQDDINVAVNRSVIFFQTVKECITIKCCFKNNELYNCFRSHYLIIYKLS